MCEYHNENPNVKQTEIGGESKIRDKKRIELINPPAMFGVERRFVDRLLSHERTMLLIHFLQVPYPKSYEIKISISFKKKATDLRYEDPKANSQILSEHYPNG